MAVTVVVLSGGSASPSGHSSTDFSLTLDAPRLVIGRGEGCDVRLPDASVSHRHASIRQRGGEYVILDENSRNGTYLDRVRLPPQTPRALRSGERVRVGRVWLELRFEPAMVKGSTAAAAKELALALVARGLRAQGEEPGPRLTVLEGPCAGATLILADAGRSYVIGRAGDLVLDDDLCARRHATVMRRGEVLLVEDGGSTSGTFLDGEPLGHGEVIWKVGQMLEVGRERLGFDYLAAEALAEIERGPDERIPEGEAPEPPAREPEQDRAPPLQGTPAPAPASAIERAPRSRPAEPGGWGAADSVVVLLALGVLVVSVVAAFWLLGR
jgi:pSer/pThr/pTyr-binding forkhead associated (FHA) protein